MQIVSVIMVSLGVLATTYSATISNELSNTSIRGSTAQYVAGIGILTLALVLSAAMGIAQDNLYQQYGRGHWEEALLHIHIMSLPMFALTTSNLTWEYALLKRQTTLLYLSVPCLVPYSSMVFAAGLSTCVMAIPTFIIPLSVTAVTQSVCVIGVHKLTSHVDSLMVSLVLAIRKALSLCLSVVILNRQSGNSSMWAGSGLVLGGIVLYSLSTKPAEVKEKSV